LLLTQIYQKSVDFVYPPQNFQFFFLAAHNLRREFFQFVVDYPYLYGLLPVAGAFVYFKFVTRCHNEFGKTPHRLFVVVHVLQRGIFFEFFSLDVNLVQGLRDFRFSGLLRCLRLLYPRPFFRFFIRPEKIGKTARRFYPFFCGRFVFSRFRGNREKTAVKVYPFRDAPPYTGAFCREEFSAEWLKSFALNQPRLSAPGGWEEAGAPEMLTVPSRITPSSAMSCGLEIEPMTTAEERITTLSLAVMAPCMMPPTTTEDALMEQSALPLLPTKTFPAVLIEPEKSPSMRRRPLMVISP
jgi:hypothetical protein